jgi:glycosyltransferase involved in cell wall biosynthesis
VRVALITHVRSKIGGTESYVEQLGAELSAAGHDAALWHEHRGPAARDMIELPAGSPSWSVESLGLTAALDGLQAWRPNVLFSHGVSTPDVESSLLRIAPTAMFVHAYHGSCVSGTKSRLSPVRMPCPRPLGVPCLLHYFPRRCGGWSPVTMARRYSLETGRRDMLGKYAAILTASAHMRKEYLKYDIEPDRVHTVGLMIPQRLAASSVVTSSTSSARPGSPTNLAREWRLLFVARLTALKGGAVLMKALSHLRRVYEGRIVLTVAGDGPERADLERRASAWRSSTRNTDVRFVGWLGPAELAAAMAATDLLVVPSIWPEPFGLVGPEAGLHSVPAAAFAVGGIPDWLREGVNGHLAPGDPPTPAGLATAIARSLGDPAHHARLRAGALAAARELSAERHMPRVLAILERAAGRGTGGGVTA